MVKTIQYGGVDIIYVDYRNQSNEEMIQTLESLEKEVLSINSFHLRLVNVAGTDPSARFRTHLRKVGNSIGKVPSKVAIVGVPKSKRVVMNAYNTIIGGNMRLFDDENEAKEYLVS